MKPAGNPPKTLTLISKIFFLAILLLVTGCSSSDTYQVTVKNQSGQPIDEFLIQVADKTVSLGELSPADTKTKNLEIDKEGTIDYRFKMGEKCYSGQLDEHVSAGQNSKKILIVGEQGEIKIIDEIHHTEINKSADNPTQQEWALPCMIPG